MSTIPAFSPGPCSTSLLRVGSRFKCTRDDLYEQCSLHITLKMPSSVIVGSRSPRSFLIFSYSSEVRPCCRRISGAKAGVMEVVMGKFYCSKSPVVGLGSLAKSLAPSFLAGDQRHTANRPAFSMTYLQAIEYLRSARRTAARCPLFSSCNLQVVENRQSASVVSLPFYKPTCT